MTEIKVMHVIARMNLGGTAKYLVDLTSNIPNSLLVTGYVQDSEIETPNLDNDRLIRVRHLGRRISPINDAIAWFELLKLVRLHRPHVMHTHTFKAGLIGRLVPGRFKRVHTFHGHLFEDPTFSKTEKIAIRLAEKFLARRTDIFISVGMRVGREIRDLGIGRDKQWLSISPGVKGLTICEMADARQALNLEREGLVIGWIGRMTGVKNPHLLLEVARKVPNIRFIMAGGGDLLPEISRNSPSNVDVIGWADAGRFLSAVNCVISTSENEGMPIALIEAQLAGKVVIATDVGSISEVIEHEVTGLLVKSNAEAIVDSLKYLVDNPILMTQMSEAASRLSPKKFSIETMLQNHRFIYSEITEINISQ